jgi:hypothetical protein
MISMNTQAVKLGFMDPEYFKLKKQRQKPLYQAQSVIYSPYFKKNIILNSRGFRHLQFSQDKERPEKEQLFKFRFLELAFEVIKQSSTIQEYRDGLFAVGNKSKKNGLRKLKYTQYWRMVAIVGKIISKLKQCFSK